MCKLTSIGGVHNSLKKCLCARKINKIKGNNTKDDSIKNTILFRVF